jgi:hypothetical protein
MVASTPQATAVHALESMVGRAAWAPTVGFGSFLTIDFGRVRKNSLGQDQGEFHFWVYGAAWQIKVGAETIANSSDSRETMMRAASTLKGAELSGYDFDTERFGLTLRFATGSDLLVTSLEDADMDDWLLYLDDGTVVIAGPGGLTRESASDSRPLRD